MHAFRVFSLFLTSNRFKMYMIQSLNKMSFCWLSAWYKQSSFDMFLYMYMNYIYIWLCVLCTHLVHFACDNFAINISINNIYHEHHDQIFLPFFFVQTSPMFLHKVAWVLLHTYYTQLSWAYHKLFSRTSHCCCTPKPATAWFGRFCLCSLTHKHMCWYLLISFLPTEVD